MHILRKFLRADNFWLIHRHAIIFQNNAPTENILFAGLKIVFDIRHVEIHDIAGAAVISDAHCSNRHILPYMYGLGNTDDQSTYRRYLIRLQLPDIYKIAPLFIISGIMSDQIVNRLYI